MILTREYRSIWASFDRPQTFQRVRDYVGRSWSDIGYDFEVGPLGYQVTFFGNEGYWDLSFKITRIKGRDEELTEYFSKVYRREITPDEVPRIRDRILGNSMGDLGVGSAPAVFATVLAIIKDMNQNYPIKCLTFDSTSIKKSQVYERLIQLFLSSGWKPTSHYEKDFMVCKGK